MTTGSLSLVLVVCALAANHLVMMTRLAANDHVFRVLQASQILLGIGILLFGVPGIDGVPVARWLLGMLFLSHAMRNVQRRRLATQPEEEELVGRRPPDAGA